MAGGVTAEVRRILDEVGRLSLDVDELGDQADLYLAGLGSHATVDVMLALEEKFEIEFPMRMLNRGTFESIDSIAAAVVELTQ